MVKRNIRPVFMPYLFDNKDAWERSISDSRWQYDMPFYEFMMIYQSYRTGLTQVIHQPELDIHIPHTNIAPILTQDEIDAIMDGANK